MEKVKSSVYLEKEFYKYLKIVAVEEDKSFSQLVVELLKEKYEAGYGKEVKII